MPPSSGRVLESCEMQTCTRLRHATTQKAAGLMYFLVVSLKHLSIKCEGLVSKFSLFLIREFIFICDDLIVVHITITCLKQF
jgi:hypothetical protein